MNNQPPSPKEKPLILNSYSLSQKKTGKDSLIEHDKAKQPYKKERAEARRKKYGNE